MTDCFRAAALTGCANFISWKFPSIFIWFILLEKCSQNAGAGVLYMKHFSLQEGMCQDTEVHLMVRTRQWLSQGEGGLQLGGPEHCSRISFCPSLRSERLCRVLMVRGPRGPSGSFRMGSSNPRCCRSPEVSVGTQAGPPDLPPQHFSSGWLLASMDALVPLEKKFEHSSRRNGKWSGADDWQKYWMRVESVV